MFKNLFFLCFFNLIFGQELELKNANKLIALPLKCLKKEYPNKLNQMLKDSTELQNPKVLHPTFYGCFDWHSSVHGHWSIAFLLNNFDNLNEKELAIQKLEQTITIKNIAQELEYFKKPHEKSFERMYGWNWLLKLQLELDQSKNTRLQKLAMILKPLTQNIVQKYIDFLPKLVYPIRVGTHTNSAFGLKFAWDYAVATNDFNFQKVIKTNALRMYQNDKNCPFNWEPSGYDFLSACMEELDLMHRILPKNEFLIWVKKFAPELLKLNFKWEVAKVSDRTDGHLVHLDGLNFSRAWVFYTIAQKFPKEFGHLKQLANIHLNHSLPSIFDNNYEGEHWLASFVLYAFECKK
jgi:Protein of unknown function (DUF2891)